MFERLNEAQGVWLAGRRTSFLRPTTPIDWLIGLRWIAAFGMLATVVVAQRLVRGLQLAPLVLVIAGISAVNLFVTLLPSRSRPMVSRQLSFDTLTLGAVLWLAGGVGNPFAVFLTFQVALAAVLTDGTTTLRQALLVVGVSAVLFYAPPIPWSTCVVAEDVVRRLGQGAALVGVAAFVGVPAYEYRQRLDTLREERAKNERLAVLGRVAGGMAHEINTPLATILVAGDELRDVGETSHQLEVARLAEVIVQEAQRASDVIAMLRGQIRAARMSEPIDVEAMLRDLVPRELDALHFSGTRVINAEPDLHAWGVPAAIRQILWNVLKNAVEATSSASGARIVLSAHEQGDRVNIVLRDNGVGIDSAQLAHLGEPFITTKETSGGTGLGLYVSGILAEQMGATLHVEGGDGAETRVTLSLQNARGAEAVPRSHRSSKAPEAPRDDGKRIHRTGDEA